MPLPLQFTTSVIGTTMTLTILSGAGYGVPVSNFDLQLGYSTAQATFVSGVGAAGYTVVTNGGTPGSVVLGGFASDGGAGQPAGSPLAVITYTLKSAIADFPLTLTNFAFNNDAPVNGTADPSVPCFVKGTRLRTPDGEVAVETLQAGDMVTSLDGSARAVIWVGQRRVACGLHPDPHNVMPVRIHGGALAVGVPARDVLLSPDHAVYVDGSLIPVRYLINGATVVQETWNEVTYVHVELERHSIIVAEGLPAESFLDTGNRAMFEGETTTVVVLPAHALSIWADKACAPLVHEGPVLQRTRQALLDRAALLGHALTSDPDLHVLADGIVVRGTRKGSEYRFALPAGARAVRLVSRQFVPAQTAPASVDHRRLGVAVLRIVADGVLHRPGDAHGWYAAEPGLQWTDGDASIVGARTDLQVSIAPVGIYWRAGQIVEPAAQARVVRAA